MAGFRPPLGSESQKIYERFCVIFEECIENNMSKDEILRHVHGKYLIALQDTNRVWNHLERENPDLFIAYNARIRERKAQPNAIENQNLQTSKQQPVIPNDFCQQVLNALGHIIKLLSDGHRLGPHPSATGSLKRKRVGENERDGNNEEAEKQIIEQDEGNDEELQKKEERGNERLQRKEGGDNEELQKNERGGN